MPCSSLRHGMITVIDWPLYNSSFSSISASRSSFLYMRLVTFLSILAPACVWAADPALMNVKTVYVMPMGRGLDQYLANHLTQNRIFDVVTDPALADAVLSDRLGPAFEQAFAELYPPPPPEPP